MAKQTFAFCNVFSLTSVDMPMEASATHQDVSWKHTAVKK